MTGHLDYILVHNYFYDNDYHIERIANQLKLLGGAHDFTYNVRAEKELVLDQADFLDRTLFPENALLYVHGGRFKQKHRNFDRVWEISPTRPDLTFIVEFDDASSRGDFNSPEAYHFYRMLPILCGDLLNSSEKNSPIIAKPKNPEDGLYPNIEEGNAMGDYILHLLRKKQ
ncbi:MAG: hypothetical protein WCV90_08020 [Candidatus Woesearchaeota archaeon]|jgi:hypothetical protein